MILDAYTHILPRPYLDRVAKLSSMSKLGPRLLGASKLFDLDLRFREMDEVGEEYRQVISVGHPALEEVASADEGAELARIANEGLAELCERYPERFHTFAATITMLDVDRALDEIDHSVRRLGARGVQIYTNVDGAPIDTPAYEPLFAKMAELDLPIWLHPARSYNHPDYSTEEISRFELWWCLGWPYETSAAMMRLVFSGLFDRYPQLKVITHHLGGMIPYFDGRIGAGMEFLGSRTPGENCSHILTSLKRPHLEYFRRFYADTAMFGSGTALPTGIGFFGAQNVVFATDAPFSKIRPTIEALRAHPLSDEDRADIMYRNVERLLKKTAV
jgi:aminocarboxymuconate-semialdehyde decarboxylase